MYIAKKPTLYLCLILLVGLAVSHLTVRGQSQGKPDILVFIADDAGWRDFGCYGNPAIRTPNIDALAAAGLRMERAFVTSPQCSPSRTSMLTGEYAHTLGTEDLHTPLPEGKRTLAAYLKESGYFTGLIRKSHIGPDGLEQFDFTHDASDESQIAEFSNFLDQAGSGPFFMWYGFIDPHRSYTEGAFSPPHRPEEVIVPPYLADTEDTRADLALYYDEIGRLDRNIGLAVEELKRRGRYENTLIIILSDNGKPFSRAKGTLYDEGIRTPLIFHWPDRIANGRVSGELVSLISLAPTLLEAAGLSIPESMTGRSLLPLLMGEPFSGDRYIFAERNWHDCDEHMRCIRSDTFKLIKNAYIEWPHGTAADLAGSPSHQELLRLRREGKLTPAQADIFQVPRPVIELYNVIDDPWELNNLAWDVRYRGIILGMHRELLDWMQRSGDFPPEKRRRHDNTDRVTGTHFDHRWQTPSVEAD
jgi:N-sulfoglucosamine sulfohydrolase